MAMPTRRALTESPHSRHACDATVAAVLEGKRRVLIEARVEGLIARGAAAERASVALDDALAVSGLRAVFGEAYPDPVQVVAIGLKEGDGLSDVLADPTSDRWSDASLELCGGTHVGNAPPSVGLSRSSCCIRDPSSPQ